MESSEALTLSACHWFMKQIEIQYNPLQYRSSLLRYTGIIQRQQPRFFLLSFITAGTTAPAIEYYC